MVENSGKPRTSGQGAVTHTASDDDSESTAPLKPEALEACP